LDLVIGRWLDAHLAQSGDNQPSYDSLLEEIERVMLGHLLERHENRPTRVAAALQMHRATLRQKLRRSGLQRDDP
jgi:two-component system nitrogen regulation response regulator GlnG/two-component system response regulator AtoC